MTAIAMQAPAGRAALPLVVARTIVEGKLTGEDAAVVGAVIGPVASSTVPGSEGPSVFAEAMSFALPEGAGRMTGTAAAKKDGEVLKAGRGAGKKLAAGGKGDAAVLGTGAVVFGTDTAIALTEPQTAGSPPSVDSGVVSAGIGSGSAFEMTGNVLAVAATVLPGATLATVRGASRTSAAGAALGAKAVAGALPKVDDDSLIEPESKASQPAVRGESEDPLSGIAGLQVAKVSAVSDRVQLLAGTEALMSSKDFVVYRGLEVTHGVGAATHAATTMLPEAAVEMQSVQTLVGTARVLEIGVADAGHGWMKVRAELAHGGGVNALIVVHGNGAIEKMQSESPALNAFLAQEHMQLKSFTVRAMEAGAATADAMTGQGRQAESNGGAPRQGQAPTLNSGREETTQGVAHLAGVLNVVGQMVASRGSLMDVVGTGSWLSVRV